MRVVLRSPRDPGLQGERTALAWSRTALAILVGALLLVRAGVVDAHPAVTVAGFLLALAAGVVATFGHLRSRDLHGDPPGPAYLRVTTVFTVTGLLTAVAIITVALS